MTATINVILPAHLVVQTSTTSEGPGTVQQQSKLQNNDSSVITVQRGIIVESFA